MKRNIISIIFLCLAGFSIIGRVYGQGYKSDSAWKHSRKNIVRYNISSALLYGFDKSFILGYERVLKPNQSISFNAGTVALPKLTTIGTDSVQFSKRC